MKKTINTYFQILLILAVSVSNAQIKNLKTEKATVYGNCDMCKKRIEAAAYHKKISSASWNEGDKIVLLSFDSTKTNTDALLKKIALAGYDNQAYLAPDAAYKKLDKCCQYNRRVTTPKTHMDHVVSQTNSPVFNDTTISKAESVLSPIYAAYFALKDALVMSNPNNAASNAKDLVKAIKVVPMEKLTVAQHMTWMANLNELSKIAEKINSTSDIEKQRESFSRLSDIMYTVMKSDKIPFPVYYDNCPMYNEGKGANWLSKENGIKNPYYGSQMMGCGSTKEIIK